MATKGSELERALVAKQREESQIIASRRRRTEVPQGLPDRDHPVGTSMTSATEGLGEPTARLADMRAVVKQLNALALKWQNETPIQVVGELRTS